MSDILKSDINEALSDNNIPWGDLRDSTVLVTGATGLIGGALVHILSAANEKHKLNMLLLANGRSAAKGEALVNNHKAVFIRGDIRKPETIADAAEKIDYIFHCAAITKSADMVAKPADVALTAVDGTRNMLELALAKRCKSFEYLSSMEIYGQCEKREVRESDLGYMDLSNPRCSYPVSKRFCEVMCLAYFWQYGLPVKTVRLAQTFGAGTPKDDARVFVQFARKAMAGEDLELHTEGRSRGNYCYTSDTVRGLLTILLKGTAGEAYNIANPAASMTIRDMAELVASDVCGGRIKAIVNIPENVAKRGYAPDVGYILNIDKVSSLGWTPKHGLAEMYRRMLASWQGQ